MKIVKKKRNMVLPRSYLLYFCVSCVFREDFCN